MKTWWNEMIELIILVPLKILELLLNCFAFILVAIVTPFVMIINAIKGNNNDKSKL